ncbi:hypothetical protein B6N60_01423 [Richelia sinica FACHB-800]|uniref:Uncharacterized protein n=1 Tax=Richelia sinica FACHB-800 TaxID=1357546 RepID=A0A975Y433_9NOST|nr:hypothetical protein B6N60_01423 [Richelia sinica FACHB-800]
MGLYLIDAHLSTHLKQLIPYLHGLCPFKNQLYLLD